MRSIRRWLLVALLGLLAVAATLGGALTYFSARHEVDRLLDEEMRQVALSLRDHARLDIERIERSAERPEQRLLVQVDDTRREQPYRSRDVAPLPRAAGEGFRDLEHAGTRWRVYALPNEVQLIQVAQPVAQRRAQALAVVLRILAPLLLLVPVGAALLWWIVGRALRPLGDLGEQLAQRQPGSLSPLALEALPGEAQPMVAALNGLLGRLQAAFEQQRALTADAAHALRTPLAAVTLQAQLAQRAPEGPERDGALHKLEAGVKRASQVVAQLLALARLDPDAAREPQQASRLPGRVPGRLHDQPDLHLRPAGRVPRFGPRADQSWRIAGGVHSPHRRIARHRRPAAVPDRVAGADQSPGGGRSREASWRRVRRQDRGPGRRPRRQAAGIADR
jgi:hypothetical protein